MELYKLKPGYIWGRIRHVISWIPTLWEDHDWDSVFLFIILREKIRKMKKYHENSRIVVNWQRTVWELKIAELTLNRIIDDNYCAQDWEAYQKKYWHKEQSRELEPIIRTDGLYALPPMSPEQSKECTRISQQEELLLKQDLEFLGKWISKHSRTWWD